MLFRNFPSLFLTPYLFVFIISLFVFKVKVVFASELTRRRFLQTSLACSVAVNTVGPTAINGEHDFKKAALLKPHQRFSLGLEVFGLSLQSIAIKEGSVFASEIEAKQWREELGWKIWTVIQSKIPDVPLVEPFELMVRVSYQLPNKSYIIINPKFEIQVGNTFIDSNRGKERKVLRIHLKTLSEENPYLEYQVSQEISRI